ncbi:MAG: 3-carboxy-cis,cis-muconate cycloisomerase, partial [Chloroflexi bacterium]|nr:3-carboxy-cis,cis-muconate cycloisomerase [Chloroflexota bacterium]
LADLAGAHTATLMVARTHSQQALPTTFGLKTAGWLAPLLRHHDRLAELRARVLVVQFGGAAGTLAALGDRGLEVQAALATELGLGTPLMPWHTQRDSFTEAAGWLSLLTGSLGKMAQDVILLGQSEIGEVRESADTTRGASSTMPQKRNPVVSEIILACARTNASLVGTMHGAMAHEHERGTHGWQVEWLVLPQMFALAAAALTHGLDLSRQLVVDRARMAANVAAANGLILAEAAAFTLGVHMPRAEAKRIVREACDIALRDGRHLIDVLAEMTSAPVAWERIRSEADYLGEAAALTARVLQTSKEIES